MHDFNSTLEFQILAQQYLRQYIVFILICTTFPLFNAIIFPVYFTERHRDLQESK